jgi:hypothetical protein
LVFFGYSSYLEESEGVIDDRRRREADDSS